MADFHLWFKEIDKIIDAYTGTLKNAVKYDDKHKFQDNFKCILLEILGMDGNTDMGQVQIENILKECKKIKEDSAKEDVTEKEPEVGDCNIGTNTDKKSWNSWLYDSLGLRYGGIHYLSRTIGLWFRVVFGKDWYSAVEQEIAKKRCELDVQKHEETYDLLPRGLNIFVDKDQKDIISIELVDNGEKEEVIEDGEPPERHTAGDTVIVRVHKDQFNRLHNKVKELCKNEKYHKFMQGEDDAVSKTDLEGLDSIITEAKKLIRKDHADDKNIFRKFTFILFRTILLDFQSQIILIIPIVDSNHEHFGTFVGIFQKKVCQLQQDELRFFFDRLLGKISQFEFAIKNETFVSSVVFVEDNVRRCSMIRPYKSEKHPEDLFDKGENRYGELMVEVLKKNGLQDNKSLSKLGYHFVGASNKMVAILKKMGNYLRKNEQESASVLLYSEPGNGKENIAKLCHLYAKRYHKEVKINENFSEICTRVFWKDVKGSLQKRLGKFVDRKRLVDNAPFYLDKLEYDENGLAFNFFPFHCGLLTKQNIQKLLFGEYWKNDGELIPGEFLLADLTRGTILFDELNTLSRPELSSWFLRVLEKPNAIVPENYQSPIEGINVLTIFTSNLSPEELKMKGFNPALLSRLRAYEIPPLRERPEDIPLLVKYFVWKSRKDISDKSDEDNRDKDYVNVTRIDTKGLHILCRLPWKDNTRELKRFVDDVMTSRIERKILTREISFDEIMRCIIEHEKKLLNK